MPDIHIRIRFAQNKAFPLSCVQKKKIQEAKKNIKNMRKASESQTMLKIAIALSHPPPPSLPSLLNNNNDENQVNLKMSEKFVS